MSSLPFSVILGIIIGHFIADFVCQSDWQAKNKSSNILALLAHIGCYVVTLYLVMMIWCVMTYNHLGFNYWYSPYQLFTFVLLNGVLHLGVDFLTSRYNTYLWKKGNVHNFFVGVGFDQYLHYLMLFTSATYFLNS